MRITEISVSCSRTVNLGNYESAKVDVSLVAEVAPTDNPDEVFESLYNNARQKLIDKIERLVS